ncbi:unnamed protein product [Paramecium sonneborni]|uniref:Uncharacterized protein n=1 Tax=Paramecium sonneborni TaxID=65129 RepID=A0A8S1LUC1_9CILI|nr:unnamed protein product [Paramecium sonneborni]
MFLFQIQSNHTILLKIIKDCLLYIAHDNHSYHNLFLFRHLSTKLQNIHQLAIIYRHLEQRESRMLSFILQTFRNRLIQQLFMVSLNNQQKQLNFLSKTLQNHKCNQHQDNLYSQPHEFHYRWYSTMNQVNNSQLLSMNKKGKSQLIYPLKILLRLYQVNQSRAQDYFIKFETQFDGEYFKLLQIFQIVVIN